MRPATIECERCGRRRKVARTGPVPTLCNDGLCNYRRRQTVHQARVLAALDNAANYPLD